MIFLFSGGHKLQFRRTKTIVFIDKVPFTHPWVRLIYTNTNAKEQKNMSQCKHPKKSSEASFVSSGMEKKSKFFPFLPMCHFMKVMKKAFGRIQDTLLKNPNCLHYTLFTAQLLHDLAHTATEQ